MPDKVYDPLDARCRTDGEPDIDVFVWGTVFLDIIFTGLRSRCPSRGTEIWADGMGSCPGGIANLAVAARRLGLRTSLAAAFGDDDYGDFCWGPWRSRSTSTSAAPAASRAGTRRSPSPWPSTATAAWSRHGHPPPVGPTELIGTPPRARAVMVGPRRRRASSSARRSPPGCRWHGEDGALVFADVGWDPSGRWPPAGARPARGAATPSCPTPARRWPTPRTETPAEALYALADLVPLAVVTNGAERRDGHRLHAPGRRRWSRRCGSRRSTRPAPATSSAPRSCSGTLAELAAAAAAGVRGALLLACRCSSSAVPWRLRAGATSRTGGPTSEPA